MKLMALEFCGNKLKKRELKMGQTYIQGYEMGSYAWSANEY